MSYKHAASKGSGAATLDAARLSEDINMLGAFADAEVEAALERLCKGEEKEESPGGDCEQGMWRQLLKLQEAIMLSSKGTSFLVPRYMLLDWSSTTFSLGFIHCSECLCMMVCCTLCVFNY